MAAMGMTITNSTADLHVIFLPFPSPGHMIPLIDIAKIMSRRHGVRATVVTTVGNAPRILPAIANHDNIALLTLPFPSQTAPENTTALPTPDLTSEFLDALNDLERPFELLMQELSHPPDSIIADSLLPWSTDVASRLQIPRIVYTCNGVFPPMVMIISSAFLGNSKPECAATSDDDLVEVPGLPHPIRMTRSQLATNELSAPDRRDRWEEFLAKVRDASFGSAGIVTNSFYELEPDYCDMFRNFIAPKKVWNVGPVSLFGSNQESVVRGGEYSLSEEGCMSWLEENKKAGSVVYVCFGTLGQFTAAQLREMAIGLEACAHPFIWVIRNGGDESEWMPEGFEMRVAETGKGFIVRGWAPQVLVLNHLNVGGFVTHSGFNSLLEGMASGIPMVTWPLFYDQFFIERLTVDVLKVGVAAGSKISSYHKEERTLVSGEQLRDAVNEMMGGGEEAEERRRRAKKIAAMAKSAIEKGGSSYTDMTDMIQELVSIKMGKDTTFG